jgi:hypothetical protein
MSDYEREDLELETMMGDRFHDLTKPEKAEPKKVSENATATTKVAQKPTHKPVVDIGKYPITKPDFHKRLWASAKQACLFGGLSLLVFYWQSAGLMAESIAIPSMCVCTLLAGWGIGKNARCD